MHACMHAFIVLNNTMFEQIGMITVLMYSHFLHIHVACCFVSGNPVICMRMLLEEEKFMGGNTAPAIRPQEKFGGLFGSSGMIMSMGDRSAKTMSSEADLFAD